MQELFWRILELACQSKPRPPILLLLQGASDLGQLNPVINAAEARGLKTHRLVVHGSPGAQDDVLSIDPESLAADIDVIIRLEVDLHQFEKQSQLQVDGNDQQTAVDAAHLQSEL